MHGLAKCHTFAEKPIEEKKDIHKRKLALLWLSVEGTRHKGVQKATHM